ncbi:MAG TPA: hypothetical protein VGY13_12665 [Solirubrobacteraceae bacterium]|jgi:membrane protein implicated in regulation of membrane protease activity|nr:hypothetical protein [Solirubrobacteraceae bacterium]
MSRARGVLLGAWEFVVGDDWRTALGVVAALALTALLAGGGVAAWWVMPPALAVLLAISVWRVAREHAAAAGPGARARAREDRDGEAGARTRDLHV